MNLTCESVRDDLPLLLADALPEARARHLARHVAECASCRDEQMLLELLRAPVAAPPALHARVRDAVAGSPPRRAFGTRRFAAAAAVVLLVGSAVIVTQWQAPDAATVADDTAAVDAVDVSWVSRADPLVHGGPGLESLTEEELELLLEEMES